MRLGLTPLSPRMGAQTSAARRSPLSPLPSSRASAFSPIDVDGDSTDDAEPSSNNRPSLSTPSAPTTHYESSDESEHKQSEHKDDAERSSSSVEGVRSARRDGEEAAAQLLLPVRRPHAQEATQRCAAQWQQRTELTGQGRAARGHLRPAHQHLRGEVRPQRYRVPGRSRGAHDLAGGHKEVAGRDPVRALGALLVRCKAP